MPTNGDLKRFYGDIPEAKIARDFVRLDKNGKIPASVLPSYVDDVIEGYYYNSKFYENETHTKEITPEKDKIYIDIPTNSSYRWSGTQYVLIGIAPQDRNIQADTNQTIESWTVPVLTIEQVQLAYNYMIKGGCTITDADGLTHFTVVHADMITGYPSVVISYYWLGFIDYQVTEQEVVAITVHKFEE